MNYNERISDYIASLSDENSAFCESLREYAENNAVPVIKRCTELFLKNLLCIKRPANILEIGTAIGYSAIMMAETLKNAGIIQSNTLSKACRSIGREHITTIEKYEKYLLLARKNIDESGFADSIKLIYADAGEALLQLRLQKKKYDFIFMDGAKAQYINWLPAVMDLLNTGGIIFADNVLQEGNIIESRFAVTRRDRCIHSRMREYLYAITHDKRLKSSILPVGDGVAVSVYS